MKKVNFSDMKVIFIAILIDFLVIFNILTGWYSVTSVEKSEVNSVSGIIEYISYEDGGRYTSRKIILSFASEKYILIGIDLNSEELYNLYKSINIGDTVNLTYRNEIHKYITIKRIIDLEINGALLQTIDDVNGFNNGIGNLYFIILVFIAFANIVGISIFLFIYNAQFQEYVFSLMSKQKKTKKTRKNQSGN